MVILKETKNDKIVQDAVSELVIAEKRLATVSEIDGAAVGTTDIYIVPAGKTLIPTKIFVRCTEAVDVVANVKGAGAFGTENPSYQNMGVIALRPVASNTLIQASTSFNAACGLSGETVKFNITLGPTSATSLKLAVDLFGYLV